MYIHQFKKEEVMKKAKDRKKPSTVKKNPKSKEIKENKEFGKTKMPVISNYYPEELPKR